jgi:FkbM family methyltransferase
VDAQEGVRQGYVDNRPGTRFFSYAVADVSGRKVKFYVAGQMSSTIRGYTKLFEDSKDVVPQEIEVETITMNDLLERAGVGRIDFLSMDIEESEPAALAGFDIGKYKPQLVCIEAHERVQEALTKYFTGRGYVRIEEYLAHDEHNWYYRPAKN